MREYMKRKTETYNITMKLSASLSSRAGNKRGALLNLSKKWW